MVDITKFDYTNGYLAIEASIPNIPGLSGCTISKVAICRSEDYNYPSSNPYLNWKMLYDKEVAGNDITEYPITGSTDPEDDSENPVDISSWVEECSLIILRIECVGTPDPDVPCEYQKPVKEAALFLTGNMYNYAIKFIDDINNSCDNVKSFNDFMMRYKAVELAVRSCNIKDAVRYYNMFFGKNRIPNDVTYPYSYDVNGRIISGGCGCGHY